MKSHTTLFTNAIIHTGIGEQDTCCAMLVNNGRISRLYHEPREISAYIADITVHLPENTIHEVDLGGQHVYPCLLDGHVHLLMTIASMSMGFSLCEFTSEGVRPNTMAGIEERIRSYASRQPKHAVITCQNYMISSMEEQRMPTRTELDAWGEGRPIVVYTIDGHSTALSSSMLKLIGIDPTDHSGILNGEENERAQGRILSVCGSRLTPAALARGIAAFRNRCAEYGISVVGAMEGNGDSPKDPTTSLLIRLARHMDIPIRLYLQYTDISRVRPLTGFMSHPRIGGCGDWEMDGSVGSHSAAFALPYKDSGKTAPCYFSQDEVDRLVSECNREGFQIASHAIGEQAVERLVTAFEKIKPSRLHRIEHCEFMTDDTFERLRALPVAVMMQPGYAWIDKHYLHSYEKHLPKEILDRMRLRSLYDAGLCLCASSDSPVQDIDPYLQIAGMVDFYRTEESLTPYEAFTCYTSHAAKALEEPDRGTLEEGKIADFFTSARNLFELKADELLTFRPESTWYAGGEWTPKKGTLTELVRMMLSSPRNI